MIIVNFSHPLTPQQRTQIEATTGCTIDRVAAAPAQFDQSRPFGPQAREILNVVGLTSEEWQTERLAVVPPALAPIACLVLAEIHGRAGYFAPVIRLMPRSGSIPPVFDVAEILDLSTQREEARNRR